MTRDRAFGIALIIISACGYGSGALFAKPAYGAGIDWLILSVWRFTFAAIVSWAWLALWPNQRRALLGLTRRRVAVLILLGIVFILNSGTYFAALETVSASLAALITYMYPALVAVLMIRFGRRLQGRQAWFALALATAGVALAVGGIDPNAAPPPLGIALAIASPIIYAFWIVMAARFSGERRERSSAEQANAPIQPHESDSPSSDQSEPAPTAAIMITATAVAWWLVALAAARPVAPWQIPADAWLPLLGVGVVSTAIALQGFYAGARRIGAAQAALVSTVEPVYTIALASILFGERLTPVQLFGGGMVITGVILAQLGSRGRAS